MKHTVLHERATWGLSRKGDGHGGLGHAHAAPQAPPSSELAGPYALAARVVAAVQGIRGPRSHRRGGPGRRCAQRGGQPRSFIQSEAFVLRSEALRSGIREAFVLRPAIRSGGLRAIRGL